VSEVEGLKKKKKKKKEVRMRLNLFRSREIFRAAMTE
jgi:hypothetical protein